MTHTFTIGSAIIALLAFAGVALAQSADQLLTITTSAATSTPAAGANAATIGTMTVQATQAGDYGTVQVRSVPITVSATGGAQAAHLTNCQIYNGNGVSVTGGAPVTASGGSQSFVFDTPVTLAGGSSQVWSVRCNVSSSMPSGGSFALSAGTPTLTPRLGVTFTPLGVVAKGAQDANLAVITLSAGRSGTDVSFGSIPVQFAFASGVPTNTVADCRIRPLSDLEQTVSQPITIQSGVNTFTLSGTQSVPAGSTFSFALTCDISATAPSNGILDLAIVPSSMDARVTGSSETVAVVRGFAPNSTTLGPLSGTVRISPTSTGGVTTTPPLIPGVPNTGLGTSMNVLFTLVLSGLMLLMGVRYLSRRA